MNARFQVTDFSSIRRVVMTLAVSFAIASVSMATDLPGDVEKLIQQRSEAISRINEKYVEALERLKLKYTQRGDLDTANAIAALITATTLDGDDNQENGRPLESLAQLVMSKIWTYKSGDATCHWTFLDGQRITSDGWSKPKKWDTKDNRYLVIQYGDGNTCTFDFGDHSNLEVLGKTNVGSARHLAPWKDREPE